MMISILHTESSLGWGGQEKRTMRELLGLPRGSFKPILACQRESQIGQKALAHGLPVVFVKMRANFDPIAVVQFMQLYRQYRVDIVHTHSSADSWMASTAAKFIPRRPVVVRTRHLSASFNTRMIYSYMADRVITVGDSTRRYMIQEKGIPGDRVLTIPTGVDLKEFDPEQIRENLREELRIAPNTPVFGTVAVFRRLKGHRYLLEATREILHSLPAAKLLLVGGGPQEKNLLRMVRELSLQEAVIMPGYREDVQEVLNTLDVFVFPSLQEALGTAILEAMAMKKPVVATRVGGIPEIVEDERNGYLVDPENFQAIAEKVVHLLRHVEIRKEMGAQGRKFVEACYDNRLMVQGLVNLYQELMAQRKT
jgi:glycosyltransferase involved in cell wall biosynthesis